MDASRSRCDRPVSATAGTDRCRRCGEPLGTTQEREAEQCARCEWDPQLQRRLLGFDQTAGQAPAPYLPTAAEVVEEMLVLSGIGERDLLFDLGCGDGRIVIAAAQRFGACAVGVDLDPERIRESVDSTRRAGVTDRVRFHEGDLFETDLSEATVVMLYLHPPLLSRLRPKLLAELRPGSRVVSHDFVIPEWPPDQSVIVRCPQRPHLLHCWKIPTPS
jgi:SAM-dependent methyltransferase